MRVTNIFTILFIIFLHFTHDSFSQFIPYNQKGKWGFANWDGKIVVSCVYEEVDFYSDDSLARVKKAGKYGYIDRKGNTVIPFEYDECHRIYEVYHGKHSIGIKKNPKILLDGFVDFSDITNNRYIVSKSNKYGVLSVVANKPKVIIPLNYSRIQFDPEKKIFYCLSGNTIQFFNTNGQKLAHDQITDMPQLEGVGDGGDGNFDRPMVIEVNGKKGVILKPRNYRMKTDTLVPFIYDEIIMPDYGDGNYYFRGGGIFGVRQGSKWGMINDKNNILLPIEYDGINFDLSKESMHWATYRRIFVVKKNDKWGVLGKKIDNSNEFTTLLPFEYQAISRIYYYYWSVQKDNKFSIFSIETYKLISDKWYSSISKYEYESVGDFELFEVKNKLGQTVYVGKNGVEFFQD